MAITLYDTDGTTVKGTYATIQLAINAADANDTIRVDAGTYNESLTVDVAGLKILGANDTVSGTGTRGAPATITGNVYVNQSGDNVVIKGFTISGSGGDDLEHSAVFVQADNVQIANNVITANATAATGIVASSDEAGNLSVTGNLIMGFDGTDGDGVGIYVNPQLANSEAHISGNTFSGNGESVIVEAGPSGVVSSNTFTGSETDDIRISLRTSGTYNVADFIGSGNNYTGGGVESIEVRSSGNSTVVGTDANEVIKVATIGSYQNLGMGVTFNGAGGNDTLVGGAGADTLVGGLGNDDITGGLGADSISGGSGNDTFHFNVQADGADSVNLGVGSDTVDVSGNANTVVQLNFASSEVGDGNANQSGDLSGQDGGLAVRLALSDGNGGTTGPESRYDDEGITFQSNSGSAVFEVRDGSNPALSGTFAAVVLGTSGADTLVASVAGPHYINGGQGDDAIVGSSSNDALVGGAGNDVIFGGVGADIMTGGAGNDTFYVDNANDKVFEVNEVGNDTVNSSVTFSVVGQYIERVNLTGSADIDATGNSLANTLVGNSGKNTLNGNNGDDKLDGGSGNDRLDGGYNNDTLTGGTGKDTFVFAASLTASKNVDTITDFSHADDTMELSQAKFTGLAVGTLEDYRFKEISSATSTKGVDSTDRILYDKAHGDLYFDQDGSHTGHNRVLFAHVADNTHLTNTDFVIV